MRYVVSDGDGQEVYRAAADLIARNPQGGSLRAATVDPAARPPGNAEGQALYVDALRRKLADDPAATYLGVAGTTARGSEMLHHLTLQQQLPGDAGAGRVRTRFALDNPLCANVLIGENEAVIAIPARRDRPDLLSCVVIDDPDFVRAMREWFDEFVWEPPGGWVEADAASTDEGPDEVERRRVRPPG